MLKLLALSVLVIGSYAAFYEESAMRMIPQINAANGNFRAGYNAFFRGKTLEQITRIMGTKLDAVEKGLALKPKVYDMDNMANMPATFTSGVDKWANCKSTIFYIKDQADCGSCWAVAASEVVADRMCIGNGGPQAPEFLNEARPPMDMSSGQIMSCCTSCGDGCRGGYPDQAMDYWKRTGVVTGGWFGSNCGCYPYTVPPCPASGCSGPEVPTPACNQRCRSGYAKNYNSDKHHATSSYRVSSFFGGNEAKMMSEIYNHGSIECAFSVYENFIHYSTGVYDKIEGRYLGGHAVKIIGWGSQNGENFWLINNSWNVTWGMQGQFKYLRGTDLAGMESQCVAGMATNPDSGFMLTC